MRDLCFGCKTFREIAYTEDETARPFCGECSAALPPAPEDIALLFLMASTPFKPGDRVEARTAAQIFDGVGVVTDVSMSLEHGATPVYPAFKVVLESKAHDLAPDEAYYTEICLTRVGADDE